MRLGRTRTRHLLTRMHTSLLSLAGPPRSPPEGGTLWCMWLACSHMQRARAIAFKWHVKLGPAGTLAGPTPFAAMRLATPPLPLPLPDLGANAHRDDLQLYMCTCMRTCVGALHAKPTATIARSPPPPAV